ncbi:MAG: T9SS type A sorting domain-containing protein [Bdellovibrionales bacterium]|nr:T9SS type A sorting domain-containing protein [Oligoflexia bacterium]
MNKAFITLLALAPAFAGQIANAQTTPGNVIRDFTTFAFCKTYVNTIQNKDYYNVQIGYSNQTSTSYTASGLNNHVTPNGYTTSPSTLPTEFLAMTRNNRSAVVYNVEGNVNLTWHVNPDGSVRAASNTSPNHVEDLPNCSPLPVELTRFEGAVSSSDASKVILSWSTASEKNSDRFEIQTSDDGATFKTIGSVQSAGTSSAPLTYRFTSPAMANGIHYFRLKQIDLDSTTAYSPVVSVTTRMIADQQASVYPNPANRGDAVSVAMNGNEVTQVVIMDATGKTVMTLAPGKISIETANLNAGMYFVKATTPTSTQISRLEIK